MPKSPRLSSNELMEEIYNQSIEMAKGIAGLQKDMTDVKEKVAYTNGKVASLMEDKIRRDERDKVLASMPTPMQTTVIAKTATVSKLDQETLNRLLLGLGVLASAVAGLIAWFMNGGR